MNNMPTIIDNLNDIIEIKSQLRGVINSYGGNVGDMFAEYPYAVQSLLSYGAYWTDMSAYVSKIELSAQSYVSSYALEHSYLVKHNFPSYNGNVTIGGTGLELNVVQGVEQGFYPQVVSYTDIPNYSERAWVGVGTLKNYVDGRLEEIESSYITAADLDNASYVTAADIPPINETLVPKADNTYTLGNSTYRYATTYSNDYYFGHNTAMKSGSDYGIQMWVNGGQRYQWNMYEFTMTDNNNRNVCKLGTAGQPWAYTYTNYLILNGTDLETRLHAIEVACGLAT